MSFSYEVNIMCDRDNCSSLLAGEPGPIAYAVQTAKREALANHWIRVKRKGKWIWLCPFCQPMDQLLHLK